MRLERRVGVRSWVLRGREGACEQEQKRRQTKKMQKMGIHSNVMIGGDSDEPRPTERIGKIKISKEAFNVALPHTPVLFVCAARHLGLAGSASLLCAAQR